MLFLFVGKVLAEDAIKAAVQDWKNKRTEKEASQAQ